LTLENPLTRRLANEPAGSDLVAATDVPDNPMATDKKPRRQFIEGLPVKGEFGFATRLNNANRLVVDKIDDGRLAYACGLRQGDVINSVDGERVTTQRELIEAILKNFETMGAVLQVTRGSSKETLFLRPGKGSAESAPRPTPDDSI
jgi:S1-C subfamily serine protease